MKIIFALCLSLCVLGSLQTVAAKNLGKKSKDSKFMKLDADHDARLSLAEFMAGGGTADDFKALDTNHDGYLSEQEFNARKQK